MPPQSTKKKMGSECESAQGPENTGPNQVFKKSVRNGWLTHSLELSAGDGPVADGGLAHDLSLSSDATGVSQLAAARLVNNRPVATDLDRVCPKGAGKLAR